MLLWNFDDGNKSIFAGDITYDILKEFLNLYANADIWKISDKNINKFLTKGAKTVLIFNTNQES